LEKRLLTVKYLKFCSESVHHLTDVVVLKCRKICPTGNRWNRALFTCQKQKQNFAASQTVATARVAPKICQSQPPNNSAPDFMQIGSLSAELRIAERVNTFLPRRVFPWFARSYALLRANNYAR